MPPLYSSAEQLYLLQLARNSIKHGLEHNEALTPCAADFDDHLKENAAAFVTLEKQGALRGCIGSVEAYRPLIEDVAEHAWNAAFRDPRFSPVSPSEFSQLHIEISVLTAPQTISFKSEKDFRAQVVPRKDGLILQDGHRRSLFLPAVWEKLPDLNSFLSHLKQKAGLPENHWSGTIQFKRFYSFEFSESV
ncbi:MAG: AmmeMemoRadiSam system protein A [Candidatus Marinimicrobia bacterium]|nr:AmmeMemoRadiSam system protein A [Candidatus Neomarinimicrobiota bacterium]